MIAAIAACLLASPPGLYYTVQVIGPATYPYRVAVRALNDEGAVVGRTETAAGANYSFVWHRGRFRWLTLPLGYWGAPEDINNRGDVVGTMSNGNGNIGVVWTAEGDRLTLRRDGRRDIGPKAINENRWVTGWVDYPGRGIAPFVWKGGGEVIDIGYTSGPPTNNSQGLEINESNMIVGYERGNDYPFYGWVWTERDGLRRVFSVHFSYMTHVNDLGQWLTAPWGPRSARGMGWGVYDRIDGEPVRRYQDFALSKINNRGEMLAGRNGGETFWVVTPSETFLLGERVLPTGTWSAAGIDINQRGQILAQAQYRPTRRSYVVLLTPVEARPQP